MTAQSNELDPKTPITLNLTVETVNYILFALQDKPFNQVSGLIGEIMGQAKAHLETNPPKKAVDENPSADEPF